MKNPFKHNDILFRRVIAVENEWIQREDDGGIIKIPKNHIWVESINPKERGLDSISTFGPIS